MSTTIWWLRQDLRLGDNPALEWAAARGAVLPVFILEENEVRPLGGAQRWWLHHSLVALQAAGVPVLLRRGVPAAVLEELLTAHGADAVVWHRRYDAAGMAHDQALKAHLKERGVAVESFNAALLHEPWTIENQSGTEFKVFTPFWKTCLTKPVMPPLPAPSTMRWAVPTGDDVTTLDLLPTRPNWAAGWEEVWTPGETGAWARLEEFIEEGLAGYGELRNRPDLPHVSRLSGHLHWGEMSPRQIWARCVAELSKRQGLRADVDKFFSELGWREFAHHLLYHFPTLPHANWKPSFDAYPWRDAAEPKAAADLRAWQRGQTGYPLVDAGMRELWATGWQHNRVRMVTASFLIKHLRLDWRHGECWFWDTLVDADAANNAASWQWVAGSGADAAPYFRIFNPIGQGEKFDPQGAYIRHWCPELARLPQEFLNAPWTAPTLVLHAAGVKLGENYPQPIVVHEEARAAALAGYEAMRGPQAT